MPTYVLPNTVSGGSITVQGNSLADAQQNAANQTGTTLAQQQGGGTFGANTFVGGGSSGGGGVVGGASGPMSANLQATQQILNDAQQKAYQAYLNARLNLDTDTLAFQKAQQAFNETVTQAGLTGTYQGMPTQAALQFAATNFGTWGMPTTGQQTLASQEQAYTQWLRAQQEARAQEALQQQTAQGYLQMMANLRGPADWAQYQKVLGATPGGLSDLVRAAAGQYIPGGGATTGVQPTPVSLQSFVGQSTGTPQDTSAMNTLVAPNQMAPQTWNALTPSQQQMLLGTWQSQGYTQEDAKQLFQQSLPKYATGGAGAGSFKLV